MITDDAYTLVTNDAEFSDALSILKMSKAIGVDTETNGLDPHKNNVRLIQLSDGANTFLIDVWKFDDDYIGSVLSDLLATPTITKVLHNAVFDLKFFQVQFRTTIRRIFDTMLAAQMLGSRSASLESVVYDYLGEHLDKTQQRSDWTQYVLGHEQLLYAALDAHMLVPLYEEQKRRLVEQKMAKVAVTEFQVVPAVAEMELTGVKIDLERLDALKAICMVRRGEAVVDFESCMDEPAQTHLEGIDPPPRLNLRSPKQVQEAFSAFGIPLEGTAVDVLKKVDHPAATALLEHRKYSKLLGTYLEPYPTLIHEKTGRIHASFHQCRTTTGRFSCSSPNLQQIPATQEFRNLFVAEKGNMLITADYSQIELRILAELSKDEAMHEAFQEGHDFHTFTAARTFGVPVEEVTKEQRSTGKTLNFALIYGQGPQATAEQIGVSVDEAKEMIEAYFAGFPEVRTWMNRQRKQAKRDGFVRTLLGRKVPLGDDTSRQEREAVNYPIQGSSADITKIALGSLYERFENYEGVKLVNCVHDEIVVEVAKRDAQGVGRSVRHVMETAGTHLIKGVPVVVDVEVAHEWSKG